MQIYVRTQNEMLFLSAIRSRIGQFPVASGNYQGGIDPAGRDDQPTTSGQIFGRIELN